MSMSMYANSADYWKARASTLAAENERMREALKFANKQFVRVEVALCDPSRPRQAIGEMVACGVSETSAALTDPAPGGERNVSEDEHRMLDKALRTSTELDYEIEPAPASPRNGGE